MASQGEQDGFRDTLDAACRGDCAALNTIFGAISQHFDWWIKKHPRGCAIARRYDDSDLFQEAALRALERLGTAEARSLAELLAWFDEIVQHKIAELWRHDFLTKKRDATREVCLDGAAGEVALEELIDAASDPCREAQRREQSRTLQDAVQELSDRDRRLIELRFSDALSYEIIAERTQRTPEAVRSALRRVFGKLIERLPRP